MDASFILDNPNTIFTNGDTISGQIILHCHNGPVTVSEISASLIGESTSILPDTAGLIMNRKEEERHRIMNVSESLLPCWERRNTRVESLRLGKGYHKFDFSLKVPWALRCLTCPQSPQSSHSSSDEKNQSSFWQLKLPPSVDLGSGARISYRIDVSVTMHQNLFKFTQRKTKNVTIWPIDTQHHSLSTMPPHQFPASKSITANILSPHLDQVPAYSEKYIPNVISRSSEPEKVLITASFLPDFDISRGMSREVVMNLKIKKLQASTHALYLQSFQILLFAYTDIHAGDKVSAQMSCWIIQSLSNLNIELFSGDEEEGDIGEVGLDSALWEGKMLPESAVPGFDGCNLARRYEAEILLGLQCKDLNSKAGRISVTQLRVPVRVPSGVLPGQQKTKKMKGSMVGRGLPILSSGLRSLTTIAENEMLVVHEDGVDGEVFSCPPTYEEATQFPPEKQLDESKSIHG